MCPVKSGCLSARSPFARVDADRPAASYTKSRAKQGEWLPLLGSRILDYCDTSERVQGGEHMETQTVYAVMYRDELLLADLIDGRFDPVVPVLVEEWLAKLQTEGWVVVSKKTRRPPNSDGVEIGAGREFHLQRVN